MKSLNKNGVSTTQTLGQEQYATFTTGAFRGKKYYQYDYRHTDGMLFSTVAKSLEECRKQRDEWLNKKAQDLNKKMYEIKQDGITILYSDTENSIPVIFNNLTNHTSKDYDTYIQSVAIPGGFKKGKIEMYKNGVLLKEGIIK